jgi:predicted permease
MIATRIGVNFNQSLTPEGCEDISKVTVNVFLPALLFTEILTNLSVD